MDSRSYHKVGNKNSGGNCPKKKVRAYHIVRINKCARFPFLPPIIFYMLLSRFRTYDVIYYVGVKKLSKKSAETDYSRDIRIERLKNFRKKRPKQAARATLFI